MSFPRWLVLVLAALLSGCAAQGAGGGADGPPAPAADTAEPGTGGNRVSFTVDGQSFTFRTPQVRHGRARAGTEVVAASFELSSADESLYARLVLHVEPGRTDLSGTYPLVSPDRDGVRAGVAELLLAEETDPSRGRRMFPSGGGEVRVDHRDGHYTVRFTSTGDDLFRAANAPPVTGELAFHAPS